MKTERNIGVGARNIGLEKAKGDFIISLDDDVLGIDDESVLTLVKMFDENPRLGAINFKVIDGYTGEICNWIHHCKKEEYCNSTFITYEITEGAVAFRKDALRVSGYYPEYFFLSHEGPDLALRLIDNGFDVIYTGLITVKHFHSSLGRKEWYSYYYDTRNQFWLAARNLPLIFMAKYLFRGQISMLIYSIRDGYFDYWLKAVWDGIKGLSVALRDRKIVSRSTMNVIRKIDSMRPSVFYMIRERLIRKGVRL